MSVFQKLLEIQKTVDAFVKDGTNTSDKYDYVTNDQVLSIIRPKMNELGLLMFPVVTGHNMHEGTTKSGTTRYLTEIDMTMVWVDAETGERFENPFYAQGVDLAGEKGPGKAYTYAEKYYLMKAFHVPTSKDDPDSDGRTRTGEKKQKGTQAGKETADYQCKAVEQITAAFAKAGGKTAGEIITFYTKNDASGYAGVGSVDEIKPAALPVVYARMSAAYKKHFGNDFKIQESAE